MKISISLMINSQVSACFKRARKIVFIKVNHNSKNRPMAPITGLSPYFLWVSENFVVSLAWIVGLLDLRRGSLAHKSWLTGLQVLQKFGSLTSWTCGSLDWGWDSLFCLKITTYSVCIANSISDHKQRKKGGRLGQRFVSWFSCGRQQYVTRSSNNIVQTSKTNDRKSTISTRDQ